MRWLINFIKRIMETTNRVFENTNTSEKKITDRGMTDLGTGTTSGAYEQYTATRQLNWRTIGSKPLIDCWLNYNFASSPTKYVFPGNTAIIDPTGGVYSAGYYYLNSFVDPSGNFVEINSLFSTQDPFSIDWKMFDVVYSTTISEEEILGFI